MGRVIAGLFVVALLIGLGAAGYFVYNARGYTTAMALPVGETAGAVGVQASAADLEPVCPLGIDIVQGEQLALFDLANAKIINVDAETRRVVSEAAFQAEPGAIVEGAVIEDGRPYVWSQQTTGADPRIQALIPGPGGGLEIDRGGGFLESPPISQEGERRLADLGFLTVGDNGFVAPQYQPSPTRVVLREWTDDLTRQDGSFTIAFTLGDDDTVGFRVTKQDGTVLTGAYELEGGFVSAQAYRRFVRGVLPIVIVESHERGGALRFTRSIIMLNLSDGVLQMSRAPASGDDICEPKQNLTISEAGQIYTISVRPNQVRINRLVPLDWFGRTRIFLADMIERVGSPAPAPQPEAAPATPQEAEAPTEQPEPSAPEAAPAPAPAPAPQFVEVPAGQSISRRQVLANACLFLNHQWTLGEANFSYAPSAGCWQQPRGLAGRLNQNISGLPYSWGGADRLSEFDRKIGLGRPAGHVCTPSKGGDVIRDPEHTVNSVLTAGVDCSGFVLRSWGWRGNRLTTSALATTGAIITMEELRPGDILNHAGSHVRMFLGWQGADKIIFMESSVFCGGVCRRVLPVSQFGDYVPIRPAQLTDEGGPLTIGDINAFCATSAPADGGEGAE